MAQYDLLLTQNVHATLVEYSEKFVNVEKGSLISADASQVPTVLPVGTNTQVLVANSATATGLEWIDQSAGHTQNTDVGTTSDVFELDTDGFQIELTAESASKFGVKVNGGATYADIEAKDATFAKVTVVAAPSAGSDLANKTYVDSILADNDAMIFKGTVGTGGTLTIAAFNALTTYNAGWTYRMIEAGTVWGNTVEIGDLVIAIVDRAGAGNLDADWTVAQGNTDGVVVGPSSAVDNGVALFDGTTGALIKDGGVLGTMAFETATDYIPDSIFTAAGQIIYASGANTPAALAAGVAGQYLAANGAAAPVWTTPGTMIGETATDYVAKALFDAHTVLIANSDNSPLALNVLEDRLVGRLTGGNITGLTSLQVSNFLWQSAPATPSSSGEAGAIAYDEDYIYVCVATSTWRRAALATNWT